MNREKILSAIKENKIIAIVRNVESDDIIPLAHAMYKGGIRLIEVTFSADKQNDNETAHKIKMLSEEFNGKMYVGAGTVLTEKQVQLSKDAGAMFIISPDTCTDVIKKTRELNMVSIPGALTPSEIRAAHDSGADFIKIYPIISMGPQYIKALNGPFGNIDFLAVGGIDENNISEYIDAGVSGFGIGANIINKKMIKEKDWDALEALANKYCTLTGEYKK